MPEITVDGYMPLVPQIAFLVEAIYSVHYFEYASDYAFDGESHNFWEFCYVDKGEIDYSIDGKQVVLHQSEILFHKPNEFHTLKANGRVAPNLVVGSFSCNSPLMQWMEDKVLTINPDERAIMALMLDEASSAFLTALNDPDIKQLDRSADAAVGSEQMVKACMEWLLISLYRRGQAFPLPTRERSSALRERTQRDFLSRVVGYFEDNICRQLTLQDVCKDNLVGRSYLQKIFRDKTGGGAMEYFGRIKIEASKRMIREGANNFTEIAAHLGYTSIHYFSRHFKKVTGMTPSEYATSVKMLTSRNSLHENP